MDNIEAVFAKNINHLIGNTAPKKIAVAVSGGVDSVALLFLVSKWSQGKDIPIYVLFVDHNLRPESKEEKKYVETLSGQLGHVFIPLSWHRIGSTGNLQEQAREGRYNLMIEQCHQYDINLLITGHHRNDIIENFLLRKSRQSGVFGLSTSNVTFRDNVQIIRPLYNIFKADVIKYLIGNKIKWYEDISNQSDKYNRNKIRKQIASYSPVQIKLIEDEILEINNASKLLEQDLIKAVAEIIEFKSCGVAKIALNQFRLLNQQLQVNLLSYVLTAVSGGSNLPRYRNLQVILEQIGQGNDLKNTIHFCQLIAQGKDLLIHREVAKINKAPLTLTNGVCWDNRLQFLCPDNLSNQFTIHKLSNQDYGFLKERRLIDDIRELDDDFTQKSLLFTLPVVKEVEKIVAIPHIFYYDDSVLKGNLKVIFKPNFISRLLHF